LPDHIRTRHVHILGATGSGKTESVILNFLKQDVSRGLGSIILDAKGDHSFLSELKNWVPGNRLLVFDLTDPESLGYNPLDSGSPLEAAQRLFSSMTWSEEYYKSKALSALQRIFQIHFEINTQNPTLSEVARVLETPDSFSAFVNTVDFPQALAVKEFQDLSGLRDQVRSLTMGHLGRILSPNSDSKINLADAENGAVIYFRLQSLMSPQIVSVLGKLIINHLNFLAGTAHRERTHAKQRKLVPVYVDEFASFACPEFADLISKARSAGFALHFSHQSVGDVVEVSPGFLNRITDNAATKIVLRINDPDSAEFFARCFGTKDIQKTTQRITNAKDIDTAEVVGEGTTRDAHQFRASPDLLKTLPTGTGAVLIAHGRETPHGASSVFKIRFPELKKNII
ncbi:MAG: type IV secretory system conjugative DNA transfer family protein, partial [Pseudobdellovibrionaceae bacterium]